MLPNYTYFIQLTMETLCICPPYRQPTYGDSWTSDNHLLMDHLCDIGDTIKNDPPSAMVLTPHNAA